MKILVMYSWDDDISDRRWRRIRSDPALRDFAVAQCFALPSAETTPFADAIFDRLSLAVQDTEPDVLLVHTGAAYHRAPEEFADCVRKIRAAYPSLRLGYERRAHGSDPLERTGAFEASEEMSRIEAAFFG